MGPGLVSFLIMEATPRNRHAANLFDGVAAGYDFLSRLFSFWQYVRWRRRLVAALDVGPGDLVLDMCTGTAGVAVEIARCCGSRVVGVDLSPGMLAAGRRRVQALGLEGQIELRQGRAEATGYPDAHFDALSVTFLLRYVDDMEATLRELVRVVKPGGRLVLLEFAVPRRTLLRWGWLAYTRVVMPAVALPLSPGWRRAGSFLGPSISRLYAGRSVEDLRMLVQGAGIGDARCREMSLGAAVLIWGTRTR
ncbi:MAG: class I SAM-dependent methyltransferase [Dehalococcoidia bacterium]